MRRLQFLLNKFDNIHPIRIDGYYGAQTEKAVRTINVGMNVNPENPPEKGDGEANIFVWCALLGGYYNA
ncbi:peptidoglycan-binding domain-containing protein [Abditibacterium utsteinense]|uniref:peptidoglycan-binding domain-containing protein n=1 Tax=Abditibacterium utsteinense TaxID=1960156 RepID=UPI001300B263|nr:hypothetical protein [Abditibacterium utsteinense]